MHTILVKNIDALARSRLVTVSADTLLVDVANLLSDTHISLVVVCDSHGAMVGIITKTNMVQQIGRSCESIGTTVASDVMTRNVTSCYPTDSLLDVMSKMEKSGFIHLPVIDEKFKPSGVVYARDALRTLMTEGKHEAAILRDYVMGIGYR
ncbi:MAG: CBS domain-containing protein [Candidatus Nitrotoga sp.]|nr:CBS domain-containing protein [Candidatus Nitrotoga sp.]MDO9446949.1 CBS domain-containing protein [Candidatus Nitrotoga sp.]MDP3497834.1 CBS domain-containing protein [Candidatus Nitrotoga sp.]